MSLSKEALQVLRQAQEQAMDQNDYDPVPNLLIAILQEKIRQMREEGKSKLQRKPVVEALKAVQSKHYPEHPLLVPGSLATYLDNLKKEEEGHDPWWLY